MIAPMEPNPANVTQTQPALNRKRCPYGPESIPGCVHYEPVCPHASTPGSEECCYERMHRISEQVSQRLCVRVADP